MPCTPGMPGIPGMPGTGEYRAYPAYRACQIVVGVRGIPLAGDPSIELPVFSTLSNTVQAFNIISVSPLSEGGGESPPPAVIYIVN